MANTIETLREHLFFTLEGLRDKTSPMEIERAKAISDVAQVIINSAKVEVDAAKLLGATQQTAFLSPTRTNVSPTAHGQKTVEQRPGYTVTTHRAS